MSSRTAFIDYYRAIIPEPESLYETINRPLPVSFWTNTLKVKANDLKELLEKDGFSVEPLSWNANAFRCDAPPSRLSKHWGYAAGLWQFQEEVSMLSGFVLKAEPGEVVLDLCAAPGNKTAQLGVAMKNQGTLIANDRHYGRMRAVGQLIKRLGLVNVSTTIYDGTRMPRVNPVFDKVMVDAPCSCEGTVRKNPNKYVIPNRAKSLRQASTQIALLQKAFQLCRPGGKILYSTCTFAPEENERVIDQLLKAYPGEVRLLPIALPNFRVCPGVTEWHGESFDPAVSGSVRIWPHLNDTGGFFLALLEKKGHDRPSSVVSSSRIPCEDAPALKACWNPLVERFGFDDGLLDSYALSMDSARGVYAVSRDHCVPDKLKVDASGLFAVKTKSDYPKLTTAAAMLWASQAKRHVVSLTESQREVYLRRGTCRLDKSQEQQAGETGYVLVMYENFSLGTALYLSPQDDQPARLKSLFPKSLAISG